MLRMRDVAGAGALVVALAGCDGGALPNASLAAQVSKTLGPDGQGSRLVACYTPRDDGTFNRVCYDPLAAASKLYVRVTGRSWCVVWPRTRAPRCP